MDGSKLSVPSGVPLSRLVRLALGTALLAVVFIVLGASGAFASSGSTSVSAASHVPDKGKGLLSGILNPVANIVDETLAQVPVVRDITGSHTVGTVVAPVAAVTDQVEATVSSVPVVGNVVAPVRGVTNAVIPPVVDVVGSITTPVLGTVDQVAAPVVQAVSPVVDPITGAVKPIVDGVTGGVADIVENAVDPVVPGTPSVPGVPGIPVTPEVPGGSGTPGDGGSGEVVPGLPDTDGGTVALPGGPGTAGGNPDQAQPATGRTVSALATAGASGQGSLGQYLTAGLFPTASATGGAAEQAGAPSPGGGSPATLCSQDDGSTVGPCAPAAAPATGVSSGSGPGGSGGSAGSTATQEDFRGFFPSAGGAVALPHADWPLPASMPSNPGSTPG